MGSLTIVLPGKRTEISAGWYASILSFARSFLISVVRVISMIPSSVKNRILSTGVCAPEKKLFSIRQTNSNHLIFFITVVLVLSRSIRHRNYERKYNISPEKFVVGILQPKKGYLQRH